MRELFLAGYFPDVAPALPPKAAAAVADWRGS